MTFWSDLAEQAEQRRRRGWRVAMIAFWGFIALSMAGAIYAVNTADDPRLAIAQRDTDLKNDQREAEADLQKCYESIGDMDRCRYLRTPEGQAEVARTNHLGAEITRCHANVGDWDWCRDNVMYGMTDRKPLLGEITRR